MLGAFEWAARIVEVLFYTAVIVYIVRRWKD